MTPNPRRLVLPLILASFLLVTIGPKAVHAQDTQTQSQSTTTKSKKKKKSKKSKQADAENSAAETNASADSASTSTKESRRSRKKNKAEMPAANESNPAATSAPSESSHTTARNERSHATSASSVHAQTPRRREWCGSIPKPGFITSPDRDGTERQSRASGWRKRMLRKPGTSQQKIND